MGLINYEDIDFSKSIVTENKIINFNDIEIRILNYLPSKEKYDLITIAAQKGFINGTYNHFNADKYFDLYIIYMYTNIVFPIDMKRNEDELYDTLYNSGLIKIIKENMNPQEMELLNCYFKREKEYLTQYYLSINGFLYESLDVMQEKINKAIQLINTAAPDLTQQIMQSLSTTSEQIEQ